MITRYALFEGSVHPSREADFRTAVLETIVPCWTAFPGALDVRVTFTDARDEGAPIYPLILAISYPDTEVLERALASEARTHAIAATNAVMGEYFTGRIHHHVTQAHVYPL
ncbi:hypothetical protein F1188_12200 [Roseospira marina]|uniref:Ethyl tert-butyl ether degradation EthD n=1 Tax=Roseospira marina TaxID=140057 RepID=A0A5M6ICG6_9PROT|nr:hypothetical protein [Roseospira marina]KAA5605318.1 hypothetical protein F1188_12200 [Roseospira marina]MBB4314786.1 hypothetical protein [Roseospira marina]MBB5087775.1 hypothetical protein [Roseospira marina]